LTTIQVDPGGDLLSVAENETLDFRKSARWNRARQLIKEGAAVPELANEVLRVVRTILAKLQKTMPLQALISEALNPFGQPQLLIDQCRSASEYAELIGQLGHCHRDDFGIFFGLEKHIVETFFNQERQRLDLSRGATAFHALEFRQRQVMREIQPHLEALAHQLALEKSVPAAIKRGKRRVRKAPRETQEQLLTHSLRQS
jgi:hypothetical protein